MEIAGLIGGTGPESTIIYYRSIIGLYKRRTQGEDAPRIILNSINMHKQMSFVRQGDLEGLADYLAAAVEETARAGATFGAIAACTPHIVFDAVAERSRIPLISIVDVTRDFAVQIGSRKPVLFGARFTMSTSFFSDKFAQSQITVVSPQPHEQDYIHSKYFEELMIGKASRDTRDGLVDILETARRREGVDALILGGTELSLIFDGEPVNGIPVMDASAIHVRAIVDKLLQVDAPRP